MLTVLSGGWGKEKCVCYVDSADGGDRKSMYAMLTVLMVGIGRVCMLC